MTATPPPVDSAKDLCESLYDLTRWIETQLDADPAEMPLVLDLILRRVAHLAQVAHARGEVNVIGEGSVIVHAGCKVVGYQS